MEDEVVAGVRIWSSRWGIVGAPQWCGITKQPRSAKG